jgi:hypothetical protein
MTPLTWSELEAGLAEIDRSPRDGGVVRLIVRRPQVGERDVVAEAVLDPVVGLVGDTWHTRKSSKTPDGSPHPDMQLNLMNARVVALVARSEDRWALAGDQLYLDLDLSSANLPPGTRLALGSAIIEVTSMPHLGCQKFHARFGPDALKFVNSPAGRQRNLRGINAKVLQRGIVRVGDIASKLAE